MNQELLLKRLQYRSLHRGCKETDLLFGKFSDAQLAKLDSALISVYEKLLDEDDADIWAWLTGKIESPDEYIPLLAMMSESDNSMVRAK